MQRRRLVEGDAQVDVDFPAPYLHPLDEQAHEPLALVEVEVVEGGEHLRGKALEALA